MTVMKLKTQRLLHWLIATSVFLSASSIADDAAIARYDHPLPVGRYVGDIKTMVLETVVTTPWITAPNGSKGDTDSTAEPDYIDVMLQNYKGNNVVMRVHTTNNAIQLELINHARVKCSGTKEECGVPQKARDRWALNLRRHIAAKVHEIALIDAQKQLNR